MSDVQDQIKALYGSDAAKAYFTLDQSQRVAMDASIASMAKRLFAELNKKYAKAFGLASVVLAERMVDQVSKESATNLHRSIKKVSGGLSIKTKIFGGDLKETFKASITANANLIKTLPQEYLDSVSSAVFRSIASGNGLEDLQPYLEKKYDGNIRKAKNVALDQTRKAYNDINADRMRAVKMTKFEWVHTGGGHKPREYHMEEYPVGLNGGIFDVNDPPIIDEKTGERGLPGHAINCKCVMRPVLEFDNDE